TAQVAGDMGAEVTLFPWTDSFSDARNKSLECARHPWILYVDADDYLPESSLQSIRELKRKQPQEAYVFVVKSTQDGITGIASAQIRMFPNMEGLKFRYRVHEQIRAALIQKGIPIVPTDIEVIHTGYTDRETVAVKQRRNLGLLQKDLADCPRDGFLHYLAGMAWLDLKNPALAKDEFIKAWDLSFENPDKLHIALGAALELAEIAFKEEQAKHEDALLWLERAEDIDNQYPRCFYLRGRLNYERGDLENALKALKRLMECQKPSFLLPLDITVLKTTGAALMGQIYLKIGRAQEAVAILNQAELLLKKSVTSQ
ncbi:MAG: glycosyltransferase, partial [Desulfuromonadales bacterium]|nr:glycosyltransferase [Desulfuromonadales bacterium]